MKVLVLGVNGMAGHLIAQFFCENGIEVIGFARENSPICRTLVGDAFDQVYVRQCILEEKPDVVINCIGILNKSVDRNVMQGIFINSYFPHYVSECCKEIGSKFIHISSDCVFSGNSSEYDERSAPDETSYYGRTKFLGEVINGNSISIRTSIVGPELKENGVGLFNWFMHSENEINGYDQVIWSGVTTLELAKFLIWIIGEELSGLIFLSNGIGISKYDLLLLFNKYFKKKSILINRCNIPVNRKVLISTRKDITYTVPNYEKMISEMAIWIKKHPSLYSQYLK